jgi:hypothetical protein
MLRGLINEDKGTPSELDASVGVVIVRKNDTAYNKVGHHFSTHGNAFLDVDSRTIFIDGDEADNENWTKDHYLFVQAHEIAHIRLKHDGNNHDEARTDYYAILFLHKKGHKAAASIGITQFKYRNGITFEEFLENENEK